MKQNLQLSVYRNKDEVKNSVIIKRAHMRTAAHSYALAAVLMRCCYYIIMLNLTDHYSVNSLTL